VAAARVAAELEAVGSQSKRGMEWFLKNRLTNS
jgi:hypothetical protein